MRQRKQKMTKNFSDVGAIPQAVSVSVFDGAAQFSDPVVIGGNLNLSIVPLVEENGVPLPAWAGTVTIQRAFIDTANNPITAPYIPTGESLIWETVKQYTDAGIEAEDRQPGNALFRAAIQTGDYTSGKVLVRIGQG